MLAPLDFAWERFVGSQEDGGTRKVNKCMAVAFAGKNYDL